MPLQPSPFVHRQGRQAHGRVPGDGRPHWARVGCYRGVHRVHQRQDDHLLGCSGGSDSSRQAVHGKKFDVYKADGTTQTLEGCYLIVDNGYHKWRTLIEPNKYPITEEDIRFSGRLES
ncbi:unnamed protein product, partial [Pylaiella littoralis]